MLQVFGNASLLAKLAMAVVVATVAVAAAYAIRPNEQRLALIRPLTLATIFAALFSSAIGAVSILRNIAASGPVIEWRTVAAGSAEALVPLCGAFGSLTVVWILVGIGFRRH